MRQAWIKMLAGGRKIFVERIQCLADNPVGGDEKELFIRLFLKDCSMNQGNRGSTGDFHGAYSNDYSTSSAEEFSKIDALGMSAAKKEIWLKILDFERTGMGLQE